MDFKEYQDKAAETAVYPEEAKLIYPLLGLANEAGEVLGKLKKYYRGDYLLTDEKVNDIKDELGDVLWYLAIVSRDLGLNFQDVANRNIEKLQARKEKGTIKGDGDKR